MDYKELAKKIAQFYRENPESWCQFKLARNSLGIAEPPLSERACKWCMVGASIKFDPNPYNGSAREILYDKIEAVTKIGAGTWNDAPGRTVNDVIDLMEEIVCE